MSGDGGTPSRREKPEALRVVQDASRVGLDFALDEARDHQIWFELETAETLITLLRRSVDEVRQRQQEHGLPPLRVPTFPGETMPLEGWDLIAQEDGAFSLRLRFQGGRNLRALLSQQAAERLTQDLMRVLRETGARATSPLN
jgi:hypothetical protein